MLPIREDNDTFLLICMRQLLMR